VNQDIRLSFNSVPDTFEAYPGWRFHAKTQVLGISGIDIAILKKYIRSMDIEEFSFLLALIYQNETEERLDAKIFSALVQALKGTKQAVVLTKVRNEVGIGRGCAAMKKTDILYRFEISKLAVKHAKLINNLKCESLSRLDPFLADLRFSLQVLDSAEQTPTSTMLSDRLLNATRHISELAVALENYEAVPEEDRDPLVFIDRLERKAIDQAAKEEENSKRGKAALGVDATCHYCGKKGHVKKDCRKQQSDQKGGGKGGKGRGKGGAGGGAGAPPKCDHCGRTGHDKSRCWELHPDQKPSGKGKTKGKEGDQNKFPPCPQCGRRNHEVKDCKFVPGAGGSSSSGGGSQAQASQRSSPSRQQPEPEAETSSQAFLAFLKERKGRGALARAVPVHEHDQHAGGSSSYSEWTEVRGRGCAGRRRNREDNSAVYTNDDWTLDSGASNHLVNDKNMEAINSRIGASAELDTVLGPVKVMGGANISMPDVIGNVDAYALDKTPNCASMGRLIEQGQHEIHWTPGRCELVRPDGSAVLLKIENYTPKLGGSTPVTALDRALAFLETLPSEEATSILDEFADSWSSFKALAGTETEKKDVVMEEDGKATEKEPQIEEEEHSDEDEERVEPDWNGISDNWKKAESKKLDYLWVGKTFCEKKSGDWHEEEHLVPRMDLWTPEGNPEEWTGERVSQVIKVVSIKEEKESDEEEEEGEEIEESNDENGKKNEKRLPKKKRRQVNRIKYENAKVLADVQKTEAELVEAKPPERAPLGIDHFLNHEPADDRCRGCLDKMDHFPSFSLTDEEKEERLLALAPLDLVGIDYIGPTKCDFKGNNMLLNSLDIGSGYPRCVPTEGKSAEVARRAYKSMFPGTRTDVPVQCPKELSKDMGKEWEGEFANQLDKDGTHAPDKLPYVKNIHAIMERHNMRLEKSTAAAMKNANMPYIFWSCGARHQSFNMARSKDARPDKLSPQERNQKQPSRRQLVPFGCGCTFYNEAREKFGLTTKEGVVLSYGPNEGFEVLDYILFRDEKKIKVFQTRDIQINRYAYPMREVKMPKEDIDWEDWQAIELSDLGQVDTYTSADGKSRCTLCRKVVTREPLRCIICISGQGRHGRGRPKDGCRRGRCLGHTIAAEQQGEEQEEEGRGATLRRRIRGKQPGTPPATPRVVAVPAPVAEPLGNIPLGASVTAVAEALATPADLAQVPAMPPMLAAAVERNFENEFRPINTKKDAYSEMVKLKLRNHHEIAEAHKEMRRALGLVFRQIDLSSREAQEEQGVQQSIDDEYASVIGDGTFDPNDVHEWEEVSARDPNARRAALALIVGEKGVELRKTGKKRRYKARLVVHGHNVRDSRGRRIAETLSHIIPASLAAVRVGEVHAASFDPGVSLHGDVRNAYIKADLKGDAVWVSLPKKLQPHKHRKMKNPVVKLVKALYGLKRSGLDWGELVRDTLLKRGWTWIRDVGETSLYHKKDVMLLIFTDDFKFSGPRDEAYAQWHEVDKLFGFSDDSREDPESSNFVGIEREIYAGPPGTRAVRLHQTQYIQNAVERLEKRLGRPLREFTTPQKVRPDGSDDILSDQRGVLFEDAPEFVGIGFWVVRCTRPDANHTVQKLAQRLTIWTKEDDALLRLLQVHGHARDRALGVSGRVDGTQDLDCEPRGLRLRRGSDRRESDCRVDRLRPGKGDEGSC
jgi:hypothetical protein